MRIHWHAATDVWREPLLAREAASEAEREARRRAKGFDIGDDAIRAGLVGVSFVATVASLMYE